MCATPGVHTRTSLIVALSVVLTFLAAGAMPAAAASLPAAPSRSLAVSVPPDPVPVQPGSPTRTLVRILNPTATPITVTIDGRALALGDNGRVAIGAEPDPRWSGLVNFPVGGLTIPALGYRDVPLEVHVPQHLTPDLYFIGFVVTPTATGAGSVHVINQIGSFVTIDVPGPRVRKLTGSFQVPGLVFGSAATGELRIGNVGRAAVQFWGENDQRFTPSGTFVEQRITPLLLPAGKWRFFTVRAKTSWPIGLVTMKLHVVYPGRTASETKELTFSKQVLIVSPVVPFGLLGLLLGGILLARLLVVRRRFAPAEAI